MALRRRLGNRVGGLAQTLLQSHLQQMGQIRGQENAAMLQRQNQEAASNEQAQNRTLDEVLRDPSKLESYLNSNPDGMLGGIKLSTFRPPIEDVVSGLGSKIAGESDLNKIPTQAGAETMLAAAPFGGAAAKDPTQVAKLTQLIADRQAQLKANAPPELRKSVDANGVAQDQYQNKWEQLNQPALPTEPTGAQKGAQGLDQWQANEGSPERLASDVSQAGKKAGAEAAATLPFQAQLAKIHADTSLLSQKEMEDYRQTHPKLSTEEINKHDNATVALGTAQEARTMLDEMDKRGMMGPIASRGAELAGGKIKSEDLFANPDDAKLAAQYFSTMKLLASIAAKAHGGVRAVSSPGTMQYWNSIVSGIGDKPIVQGQLDAVEQIMKKYQADPHSSVEIPALALPGGTTTGPADSPWIHSVLGR